MKIVKVDHKKMGIGVDNAEKLEHFGGFIYNDPYIDTERKESLSNIVDKRFNKAATLYGSSANIRIL